MKYLVLAIVMVFSLSSFAGFGGSRGGFSSGRSSSSFSRGSSSFGGSRSTARAPIVRPSSSSGYSSAARSAPLTTVIHTNSGSGMGFWHGMMIGNMMHRPTTVVAGQPGVAVVDSGASVGWSIFWVIIIIGIVAIVWIGLKNRDEY